MKSKIANKIRQLLILNSALLTLFTSCSIEKQIGKSAKEDVLDTKALQAAHVGISIFDPAADKYLYNYQGDKYFVPASNTKLPTCYAAMKYLGDSLTSALVDETDTSIVIIPKGDPTVLHPDFKNQPLIEFLKKQKKSIIINANNWEEDALGSGWSWNDYNESYMNERSPMPIYGNIIKWVQEIDDSTKPPFIYSYPEVNWIVNFSSDENNKNFNVVRDIGTNTYILNQGKEKKKEQFVPFATNGIQTTIELLEEPIGKKVFVWSGQHSYAPNLNPIHSQPTDSLLKPMMHRSDNFFAEQSLLMVSNERLGVMNDAKIIDTLLKTDFKDLPQKPRWVDGSGLSRYNLFTPQDFVAILNKMKNEFGMERIKVILPTGGEGTISSYYKTDSGYIYGKTGTLSGVVAFSGFLYTKKRKLLIFSTLVNNHQASATEVRRAVEKFLQGIRNNY
jgi:D-alanyl-D-alanine carboxypeptidase/D-alanyl-D-alanine-endopeptidase (penicillin-binding protein 4)